MKKWSVKHKPTGKFYYEDEGGIFLVEIQWAPGFESEKVANEALGDLYEDTPGMIFTEDGEFPKNEFEVVCIEVREV
jgi:hypothetical protein